MSKAYPNISILIQDHESFIQSRYLPPLRNAAKFTVTPKMLLKTKPLVLLSTPTIKLKKNKSLRSFKQEKSVNSTSTSSLIHSIKMRKLCADTECIKEFRKYAEGVRPKFNLSNNILYYFL